ncbi:MAG: phosphatase domain-containing putative toxin [Acidiferrobacter sp.]
MDNALLNLSHFGVAFGERTVLSDVTMTILETGIVTLLGPAGTGKSTLLRTLAGFNEGNPSLRTWGAAHYAGEPLGTGARPALVSQSARLMISSLRENIVSGLPERSSLTAIQQREFVERLLVEGGLEFLLGHLDESVVQLPLAVQRHVAILRQSASGPRLLCIDEPTTGLRDKECEPLLAYIQRESVRRAVLIVLHNQAQARRLGGDIVLLAGGVVQETQVSVKFFDAPQSAAGREFVRVGTCCVPSPDTKPEDLDAEATTPSMTPASERNIINESFGPRGFLWLKRGVLAGTPRPGIVFELRYDLDALKRVGVTALVSLTETPIEEDVIGEYGIKCLRSPIPDMGAPDMGQAIILCQAIERMIAENEVIAVHCRAGMGRTGTVLASYLIWEGASALAALEAVRRIEPRWVQSDVQTHFLEGFARYIAGSASESQSGWVGGVV